MPTVGGVAAVLVAALVAVAVWLILPGPGGASRPATAAPGASRRSLPEPDHPEAMELLALALAAGLPVQAALDEVARTLEGARGQELRTVATALAWGVGDPEAWAAAGDGWASAGAALAMARRAGVAPSALLREAASDERRRRGAQAQDAAGALAVRLVIPLGLLFLPAFVLTTVLPVILALATDLLAAW